MKEGETFLDIGSGWGTLSRYAAREKKVDVTGITLFKEQKRWADDLIKRENLNHTCRIYHMDYRQIPSGKFDKVFL